MVKPEGFIVTTITVPLTVSDELVSMIGSAEELAERARQALVLDLLRDGEISQGKAAQLLGISRHDMLLMAAQHQIPSGPATIEELNAELEAYRRMGERAGK
jgi:predicted HTH domain antitoxin